MNRFKSFLSAFQIVTELFRDRKKGRWPRIVSILALIYLILPVDLVADFIPFFGLIDDMLVVLTAIATILKSLKNFKKSVL